MLNNNLLKFISTSVVTLGVSLGLVYLSSSYKEDSEKKKIKDLNWRRVLKDIKYSFDLGDVSGDDINSDMHRRRLLAFLELYVKEHPSQDEYFKEYLNELEELSGPNYSHRDRMNRVRKIANELEQPIS